jgi:hypothetical protein
MRRILVVIVAASALAGCTGAGLAFNALGDLAQDAKLDDLEARVAVAEREKRETAARLEELQRRVDTLEREAVAARAARATEIAAQTSRAEATPEAAPAAELVSADEYP